MTEKAEITINDPSVISIILPTRGRVTSGALEKSLLSLLDTAQNPGRIEIMLGVDEDDQETLDWLEAKGKEFVAPYNCGLKAKVFKPLGYKQLHMYVNLLSHASSGEWLFLWNDDALMQTAGWDLEVDTHNGQFRLLAPSDNHDHPFAIFPLIPMDWFTLVDCWSMNSQNDTWVSQIAKMNNIFTRCEFTVLHDRADLTGGNDDKTFADREYMEGNPEDPQDFNHPNMSQARMHHATKIDWFLKRTGTISAPSYFEQMLQGQVNPFANLTDGHNPKGAGQLSSINSSEPKLPEDTVLKL
ncbi:hypothetical protein N8955_00620 [bacterium]|jgi:hypothetical protein|nr:hypothetical protein [Hellea sp.]MDA7807214.1 hypothetical protein [bacterium]MDA9047839.1 hypothetical protein [Hellea sp.]